MREQKFRFIFKDGNFIAKRYMTLDELLDSNFALEQMKESINSESNIFDIEDYPDYEVFKDEYTELKDENGVEIYAGDICKINYSLDSQKDSYCENGIVLIEYHNGSYWAINKEDKYHITIDDKEDLEVIGNIYENPELLSEI